MSNDAKDVNEANKKATENLINKNRYPMYILIALAILILGTLLFSCIFRGPCRAMSASFSNPFAKKMMKEEKMILSAEAKTTWSEVSEKPLAIYFAPNSEAPLVKEVEATLKNIVEYLKVNKAAKIMVAGHANFHKDRAYADKLGMERADNMKAMLVTMGADANQIETVSKGQSETVSPFWNKNAAQLNRRVVISVVK